MPFMPPQFNLLMNVWNGSNTPFGGAADLTNVPVQKYILSRISFDMKLGDDDEWTPPICLRLPITETTAYGAGHIYEVPAGSHRYYRGRFKEIMHETFSNEYYLVIVFQCDNAGVEIHRFIQ